MEQFNFDPEELKKQQDALEENKGLGTAIGSAAQSLANVPTMFENLYGGHKDRTNLQDLGSSIDADKQQKINQLQDTLNQYRQHQLKEQDVSRDRDWQKTLADYQNAAKAKQDEASDARDLNKAKTVKQMEIDAELGKVKAAKEIGKDIPAAQVVSIDDGNTAISQLDDIEKTLSSSKELFGPLRGRWASINPTDEKAQVVNSQLKTAAQKIGTFLEGGKLTDNDVPKYEKMLPTLSDPPNVAVAKLALIKRMIIAKQQSNIQSLKGSGYDTRGVARNNVLPDLPDMNTKKAIGSLVPSAQAGQGGGLQAGHVEDGHVFLGGDPSDQNNWKEVQ